MSREMIARHALRLNLQAPTTNALADSTEARDSDEALVARARGGDFDAFELLFERHRGLVFRFAYQSSGRRDDAEDVVQEVFTRAYQNLHRYRDEAKFTTWLLRIAMNLSTDRARMSQRRASLEAQEAAGALAWMTVGDTDDPVENLESERRSKALRQAIGALPDHHRNMIVMRDIEEWDYKDIASTLNCTVGGAKLRVLRARRALRDKVLAMMQEGGAL
ncbi:MAG: sigma-70 family RNA polymerase sigma factor [Fimbriimonadaceae bacterium]|nr:sigma-70 family RNA polymerase sigma factor [Fimbriimonadaceae bacterium]QYK57313.1 MAG: sigma-70 family RNA polymerase sigma factor [Fimbriimonadaceae bacterium]